MSKAWLNGCCGSPAQRTDNEDGLLQFHSRNGCSCPVPVSDSLTQLDDALTPQVSLLFHSSKGSNKIKDQIDRIAVGCRWDGSVQSYGSSCSTYVESGYVLVLTRFLLKWVGGHERWPETRLCIQRLPGRDVRISHEQKLSDELRDVRQTAM